jgi:heme A synthase
VANVHMVVGTLVVIAFAIDLILRLMAYRGKTYSFTRMVAMAAGGLLLVQYVLGFGLLSSSDDKPGVSHYVLALAAIITVGAEHMVTSQPGDDPKGANVKALRAVAATLVLVLAAYLIGQSN